MLVVEIDGYTPIIRGVHWPLRSTGNRDEEEDLKLGWDNFT